MRPADIAKAIDHCHHHEAEGECNAGVTDDPVGFLIHDDGSRAREDEPEGPEELRQQAPHFRAFPEAGRAHV